MMAIDMGGPFNKAAYVFATAALTEGNAAPITAAMVGGMIPPLAIATAMFIFKRKFTKSNVAQSYLTMLWVYHSSQKVLYLLQLLTHYV